MLLQMPNKVIVTSLSHIDLSRFPRCQNGGKRLKYSSGEDKVQTEEWEGPPTPAAWREIVGI